VLTMTQDAADLVRTLAQRDSLPAGGGLRIVLNRTTDSLSMGLAAAPGARRSVIARHGALLFLSRSAERRTHGRTLCAEITPSRSTFHLDR
jgi:hypothetical protein